MPPMSRNGRTHDGLMPVTFINHEGAKTPLLFGGGFVWYERRGDQRVGKRPDWIRRLPKRLGGSVSFGASMLRSLPRLLR